MRRGPLPKSNKQYITELARANPNLKALEEYITADTAIWHWCNGCQHIAKLYPTGCNNCRLINKNNVIATRKSPK